jgi:hypothetical protein
MYDPPSLDGGEMTDKVLSRRAAMVELYAENPSRRVIMGGGGRPIPL